MSMKRKIPVEGTKFPPPLIESEMSLRSNPKEIRKVEEFLLEMNSKIHLNESSFHRLLVATTEAVNNAIVHGNKLDRRKRVKVSCEWRERFVRVKVEDRGGGFNPRQVPDPLKKENLLKESGRGVFLMRSMMDAVEFRLNEHGTTIVLTLRVRKKRGSRKKKR